MQDVLSLPLFAQCYLGCAVTRDISTACLPLWEPPALPKGREKGMPVALWIFSNSEGEQWKISLGLGVLSCLCHSCAAVGSKKREKASLWGCASCELHPVTQNTGPEGLGRCGAQLLMQGCLLRKAALDVEGTISTFIF